MSLVEITIPLMGEGIIEATIIRWLVREGENVEPEQPVVEIATDKVDSEIASPSRGVVNRIMRKEGDIPKVGEVIALINTGEEESIKSGEEFPSSSLAAGMPAGEVPPEPEEPLPLIPAMEKGIPDMEVPARFEQQLTPFIRKIARDLRISREELHALAKQLAPQRITKDHLYAFTRQREQPAQGNNPQETRKEKPLISKEQLYSTGNYEVRPLGRMRKLIAEHMVYSSHTAPHVTSFHETDLSELVKWRDQAKALFQEKHQVRLTFTPIFVQMMARAIHEYPMVNVSLDGDEIVLRKDINIGIATALPDGNLVVPVIRNADQSSLAGLAAAVNDLSERARTGKLLPHEIIGGTITLTNLGMFGSLTGTPIINQPESAILAVGSIRKKPAVVTNNQTHGIGIRDLCILSLSYDHRVIDGALGGSFLARVASLLENFASQAEI